MRLAAGSRRCWHARSRTAVALVVLTAWFASLLVAAPLQHADAGTATPAFVSQPPAVGNTATPTWTFTLPADSTSSPVDVVPPPTGSDTATATITTTHRPKCLVLRATDAAPDPATTVYGDCGTPTGVPGTATEYTYTASSLAPGAYTLYLHDEQTETTTTTTYTLGTPGPPSSGTPTVTEGTPDVTSPYTYDNTPPDLAWVATPPASGTSPSPSATFTVGIDATAVSCAFTVGTATTTTSGCTSPYQPSLPADGAYTLSVTATDAAGNSATVSTPYTLQTAGAPGVAVSPTTGNASATPTWTITPPTGTTPDDYRVTLTPPSGSPRSATLTPDTTGAATYTPSPAPDTAGTWRLAVTATVSGRPSATGFADYVYDNTAPAAPAPTANAAIGRTMPTWAFAAGDAVTAQCQLLQGTTPLTAVSCTSLTSFTPASLPADGDYFLTVTLTDAAGNSSTGTSTTAYTYDATAPGLTVTPSAPTAATGFDPTPTWAVTATDANGPLTTTCVLTKPDGTEVDRRACGSSYTAPTLTDNITYTLTVTATDAATNVTTRTATYAFDNQPPTVTVSGPTPTSPGNSTTVSWTSSGEADATTMCELRKDSSTGTIVVAATSCPRTKSFAVTAEGTYVMVAWDIDLAGNSSTHVAGAAYTLDRTPPTDPTVSGPTGPSSDPTIDWSITGIGDATRLTCRVVDVTPLNTSYAPPAFTTCPALSSASAFTYPLPYDSRWRLDVITYDAAGNPSNQISSPVYELDTARPLAPSVTGPSGHGTATSGDYSWTGESGITVQCQLERRGDLVPAWATCPSPLRFAFPTDGTYVLHIRLIDRAQNVGAVGDSPEFERDTTAPVVTRPTGPAGPSQDRHPTWTFTTETANGVTTTCRLTRSGVDVQVLTDTCAGTFTGDLTGQSDGLYTLTVTATDLAQNTTSVSSGTYELDTTKPVTPVVTGLPGPSQNRNPVFSWTAEPGASAECSLKEKDGAAGAWSGCATPYAPALPADGTWVLSVRLRDAADNVSDTGTSGPYVLDTTAPVAPTVTPPTSPGRDLAPSWSAVTEEGSTTECRLTGPGQLGAWGACTLPTTTALSGDGAYTFEVRATDAAGNVSQPGAGSYVLDTVAPGAPAVTQPTGPGRSRTPSIAFSTEPGTSGSCRLTHGSTVLSDSAPCSNPATLDLSGLPDGAYTLSVRAVDAAGNVGPAGTATYVLDTTAPNAPTLTLVAGSPSSDRSPVFGFNAESGTTVSCKVTTPSGAVKDLACASPLTLDLSGATDGDYVLAIRATDPAGNTSAPATTTFRLDSSAPAAPRVVGPPTPGSIRNPVWKVTSASPAECRLTRGTTVVKDWMACGTSYAADLYAQPDGAYILEARVVGTTAPTSSRYRLDTTGPAAATLVAPPSPGTDRHPTWAVSSPDATATAECRVLVFTGVLKDWTPCPVSQAGSLYSFDLTGHGDGTYTLAVRLTDAAGNLGPTATSDYVLDTSAPAAVGVIAPLSPGNDTTPTWTLTSAAGVKLECRISSGPKVISDFAPCAGTFTADLTGLPDGTYTLTVHALSAAGTPGPETTSGYLLDTTAAGAPGTLSGPTGPSRDRAPRWTFTLAPGTTAQCTVMYAGKVFRDGPCTSPYVLDLSTAADGSYTLTVRAVDAAGNLGSPSTAGYVLKTTPPPAPALTMQPGSPSSTTDPAWGFSLFRGTTAQCRLLSAGSPVQDWTACTSPTRAPLAGRPDGAYTLQVRALDAAGNTSAPVGGDYTLDRTAAPLAVFTGTPSTPGNDTTPTWVIAAPPAAAPATAGLLRTAALSGTPQTECRLTTPRGAGAWAPCAGSFTATTNGDGSYLLEVRAFDSTGERGPASSSSYQLDTRAPAAPRFTDPLPPLVGNDAEVAWTWTEDDNLVECRLLRNGAPVSGFAACTPPYVAAVGRLGEATYAVEVRAVDAAGNIGPVTTATYRYDITPPAAPAFVSRPPSRGLSSSVGWTFAVPVDTAAVCVVTRNGTVVSEGACAGSFGLDLRGQQPATWALSVHLVDAAGNAGPASSSSYTLTGATGGGRVDGSGAPGGGSGPATNPGGGGVQGSGPGSAPHLPPAVSAANGVPTPGVLARIPAAIRKGARELVRSVSAIPGAVPGTDVPSAIKNVLNQTITKPQLPLALLVIVLLFLLVQNRIDRRDPKLAAAPMTAEPELTFGPILRPGGVTA